ncbi:MAG: hypothetical protein Q7V05_06040 [Methanoregula sp.]|nr:hypothetical protein [Methanoregula sp.]
MVRSDGGQLYTIEGLAAALIMVITAYMIVNATSVYTAGDTHISDMQLETMGNDALTVMGTPMNTTENNIGNSPLRMILEGDSDDMSEMFRTKFLELVNTGGTGPKRDIQFVANYTCRDADSNAISSIQLISSSGRSLTGTEHPVRVTKWVITNTGCGTIESERNRAALVEVLLWLD